MKKLSIFLAVFIIFIVLGGKSFAVDYIYKKSTSGYSSWRNYDDGYNSNGSEPSNAYYVVLGSSGLYEYKRDADGDREYGDDTHLNSQELYASWRDWASDGERYAKRVRRRDHIPVTFVANITAPNGTYPDNGKHSDGYYYEKLGLSGLYEWGKYEVKYTNWTRVYSKTSSYNDTDFYRNFGVNPYTNSYDNTSTGHRISQTATREEYIRAWYYDGDRVKSFHFVNYRDPIKYKLIEYSSGADTDHVNGEVAADGFLWVRERQIYDVSEVRTDTNKVVTQEYYYDKYNADYYTSRGGHSYRYDRDHDSGMYDGTEANLYESFETVKSQGNWYLRGTGSYGKRSDGYESNGERSRYRRTNSERHWSDRKDEYVYRYSYEWYHYDIDFTHGMTPYYYKTSLAQSNLVAMDGDYPNNGRHTDGFWYVKKGIANQPPVVTVTNTTKYGKTTDNFVISGNVTDANGGNVSITATINGKAKVANVASGNGAYTLTWTGAEIGLGTHTNVVITATDNKGATDTVNFASKLNVDNTAPNLVSAVPTKYTYKNGNDYWIKQNETFKIKIRGYDALPGIRYTYIRYPGAEDTRAYHDWQSSNNHLNEFDTSTYLDIIEAVETLETGGNREVEFTTKGLKNMGQNEVQYYFTDYAGNVLGYINTGYRLGVDTVLPAASVTVTVNSSTSLTVAVTASDSESGIKDYSFDGGSTWQVSNSKTFSGLTPNTQYTYNIRVRDNTLNVRSLSISQYTNANTPSGFTATKGNTARSRKIDTVWNANSNAGGTTYELEVSDNGTSGWTNIYTGTSVNYGHNGILNDTGSEPNPSVTKYYRVRAKSHNGNYTGYTSVISGDTLATPVTTIEEYSSKGLNTGKTRLRINWNSVPGAKAYGLYIFDGYAYRFINLGNVLSFDSDVLRFFPTKAQIASWGGTADIFKRDGSGDFVDSSWNDLYVKANGGEVYNTYSYHAWIHLISIDDEGTVSSHTWHGANYIDPAGILDNDPANEGTVNLISKDTKSIIVSASATDKYMTENNTGSGVKDYKFLNVEKSIESSYTQEHEFGDLLSNKRYNIKVKARDNNLNENEYSSAYAFVTMPEKPENISIYSIIEDDMYIRVTPSSKNETVPELKVIAQNVDVLSNKIESTYTDEEIIKLEGFTPGANYKVTYKMRNLDLEETEEVLIDEVLFIKKDAPTSIDEFEVNYGNLKTTQDEVDAKLVVTDNIISKNDLRVKFIINGNGYGYDFDEGKWKSDYIGKYSKYYGGIPLEKDGENKIEVNVYDGVGNVSKEIRYISKEKNGGDTVIIDNGNNSGDESSGDNTDKNIGGTINEGIVTAEGYILVKERNVKLELDVENVTEISYSSNGVRWSPWEKVTGNKVVKYVTLDNEPSELKTVYVKSKNEFGEGKKFKEILYKLDREGPKVKVSAANNINIAQNGEINLRLEMLDNVTKNIRYVVEISKDGENTRVIKGDSAGNESVIQKVVGLNDGFYNITLTAYDQLGNVGKNKLIILSK
ncbi:MAG: hypothetical protein N4A47_02790 [Clostridia bacterium]|jgi:hypothetical protein|nr:hypothetical protein [Clostridia bacterium]